LFRSFGHDPRIRSTPRGVVVEESGMRIALDPRGPVKADYIFISHAHSDHVPSSISTGRVIASSETARLVRARGLNLREYVEEAPGLQPVDTGHILGAKGLMIEGRTFYTGDLAGRPRGFLPRGKRISCEKLLIESTYGTPQYVFPPTAEALSSANKVIAAAFAQNRPVALMGYPLGKCQLLSYLFQSWDPLYSYGAVYEYNEIYRELGVDLPESKWLKTPADVESLGRRASLVVSPSTGAKGGLRRALAAIGAVTVGFSGWALEPGYRFASKLTHAVALSDHADFRELTEFVTLARPEKVYTMHGFTEDFALHLKAAGFDAAPLGRRQLSLTEYME